MNRDDSFTLRVNPIERQMIAAIAERLDRTESDTVRVLIHEKARELGIIPRTHESGTPRPPKLEGAAHSLSS